MLDAIISLFTIFLYTALGTYVLTKNPHERTNKIFAILMLVFIIWSIGTYNIGIADVSSEEALLYIKIQLSGAILALTVLVFFALSITKAEKVLKNPLAYLLILPSIYILYLIWFSEVSNSELNIFSTIPGARKEFFLFSGIFAVTGVYLLLKYYSTSKYREREQAKFIVTGTIAAILTAIVVDIILPLFFSIYVLQLSTIAPAVMGVFLAYAVFQHGLFIRPMPEISATSFCGTDCTICPEYLGERCRGCKFEKERYKNCAAYSCIVEKGLEGCRECPEIITCTKRKANKTCFSSRPALELKFGQTFFAGEGGYDQFLEAVRYGYFGIIATASHPQQIRAKYDLATTPIVWVSDEAFDMGVPPEKLGRLGVMLINFMKSAGNAVVLLDCTDKLITVNGFENVERVIKVLNNTAHVTNSLIIIRTALEGEALNKLRDSME